ncbi:MAG: 2-dehydropantoate 2-reductase [Candidatus Bathyarchaeota archaeon]|nr:2-dehydropantoate 2-reductase [Candidatus Bathyarchaeota archaeon]
MIFNQIYVLGAGAIGSVYGALLSRKNSVTLVGRKAHIDAVNSNGLCVLGDVNEVFHVKAETEIHEIPQKTLIILTTKAHETAEAIKSIKKLLRKDTAILIMQNGVGNEEAVNKIVGGKAKVLRGLTMMAAEFFEPGKVKFWRGETVIEINEVGENIAKVFNECGLKTRLSKDIVRETWCKLIINCVVNPLTALFRVRNFEIASETLKAVRHEIIKECIQVAEAEGICLPNNIEKEIVKKLAKYTNFSSMYQDILKGKKTEIDFLNGKIVELGRKNGIPTPVNEALVSLIKFLEGKSCGFSGKD